MKQLKSLVLLLIALFVVSGCQSNELGEKSPYAKNISHLNGLSIELDADIYAPGEEASEGINLEYYEPLDEGKYRIIRLMYGGPLAAEFEVVKE